MRRGAKPAKAKVKARSPVAGKSPKGQDARVSDLEKRLAEALRDKSEALEQQAATAEILSVISSSPTDVQPVLDTVAATAARLCEAFDAVIRLRHGDELRLAAHYGPIPVLDTISVVRGLVAGRAVLESRTVHIPDVWAEAEDFPEARENARRLGWRTQLTVPLLRGETAIGTIAIRRPEVRPFTHQQIGLLQTFANQAVIAIENVRLFTEATHSLDHQTATSEILRVIASSPSDLQPVLDAIAERTARLCDSFDGSIYRVDGNSLRLIARKGLIAEATHASLPEVPLVRGTVNGRAVIERRTIHITDLQAEPQEYPEGSARARQIGWRTQLSVPLLREGGAIGVIAMRRLEVRPFTDEQIALVETFADQAVIAIENVRLFQELEARNRDLAETLEQQTATSEILKAISQSPTDIQPVLDAVAANAARVCGATDALILRVEGADMRRVAHFGSIPLILPQIRPVTDRSVGGRAILDCHAIHVDDILDDARAYPDSVVSGDVVWRTTLAAPLVREGVAIGAITIRRTEVRPFTDKQIRLLETFADQAVIAIENVRLFNETKEALEQQTATSEILRVIARSPTGIQPVLETIVEQAGRVCGAFDAIVFLVEGDRLVRTAHRGPVPITEGSLSLPIERDSASGVAVLECRTVHVEDLLASREFPRGRAIAERSGFRTAVSVPLVKERAAIGTLVARRTEMQPFTTQQIALLETFADQAVIAIENVRLFTELQASNRELTTALDTQNATSDILRVISRSQTDVQPVFDAIVISARRLLRGYSSGLTRVVGNQVELAALTSTAAAGDAALQARFPLSLQSDDPHAQAIRDRAAFNFADFELDSRVPEAWRVIARARGWRSGVVVPMLRHEEALGTIAVTRREPGGFVDDEITLLQTFADQAVIAIENVRLFNETKEALGRQTATAEILRVIASSPTELQPALDAIATNAAMVCDAYDAVVFLREGDHVWYAAHYGPIAITQERSALSRDSCVEAAILDRQLVHVDDLLATEPPAFPLSAKAAREGGFRTVLCVPLLRQNEAIGALAIRRREVQPFTTQQIELLKTFADQAVIAIENVRLFTELQEKNRALTQAHGQVTEALEQQTATGEILRVISRSPTDLQPVFDAIVSSAVRLCGAAFGGLQRLDGNRMTLDAQHGVPEDELVILHRDVFPLPLSRESATGRAVLDRAVIHIPDIREDPDFRTPRLRTMQGYRAILAVPLLRDGTPIGALALWRSEVRPFSETEIGLVQTFADQAVIAIENVRLFKELEARNRDLTEALDQQTATGEILQVISRSPTDAQPVFDAIVRSVVKLCDGLFSTTFRFDGELLHMAAHHNASAAGLEALNRLYPARPTRDLVAGRAILDRAVVHITDADADLDGRQLLVARTIGWRSALIVPMLREGAPIGVVTVARAAPGPFSDSVIALLKTFADQAVIAIENVRLFTELQARNRDLTEALDRQTATADILRAISQAQTDVQPVFEAITDSAMRLLGAGLASMALYDGEMVSLVAARGGLPGSGDMAQERLQTPHRPHFAPEQAVITKRVHHVEDVEADPSCDATFRRHAAERGFRSFVSVPMLRGNESLGMLVVSRAQPGGFSGAEVTLLQTFADQAVIAVENTRLLAELQARTADLTRSVDQLTALGEVGRAVSSTLDLATVLTTIVSRAVELSGLDGGVVFEYEQQAEEFVQRAQADTGGVLAAARRGARIRKGEGVVGRTAITLEPVQVADITVPGSYVGPNRETLIESGIRALVAVPMVREGELIGCLGVSRNRPGNFPVETIELLRTFATQSALAIQNARLFHEIEDKSRQLEAASRHKSEFLANMSHELRTPLNAIIGFSEVLAARMFGAVNAKQAEYLQDILESGQHLLSLINDILDLSKIEAGRMELEGADFDLPSAIDNALILVRERASRRGITLASTVDEHLGLMRGDERKVKQVLLNLLSNALKFTPEGGRVDVRAVLRDGQAEVSVADTGVGIAPEDQEAVFEEFRQVGTADKKVEGTGLGLALSRKFVELHGGRIWVESELGRGSTFTFTLPVG